MIVVAYKTTRQSSYKNNNKHSRSLSITHFTASETYSAPVLLFSTKTKSKFMTLSMCQDIQNSFISPLYMYVKGVLLCYFFADVYCVYFVYFNSSALIKFYRHIRQGCLAVFVSLCSLVFCPFFCFYQFQIHDKSFGSLQSLSSVKLRRIKITAFFFALAAVKNNIRLVHNIQVHFVHLFCIRV